LLQLNAAIVVHRVVRLRWARTVTDDGGTKADYQPKNAEEVFNNFKMKIDKIVHTS
jgi:hypothetical protein